MGSKAEESRRTEMPHHFEHTTTREAKGSSRTMRVFVSSTFRDLNDERNYLVNVVFPELVRIARQRSVHVTFIDLRWGVKDEDVFRVIERCFAEIDQARPHFIGILANRYGYIPGKEEVDKIENVDEGLKKKWGDGKYSLTHMEMDYGVFTHPEMAEYAYFYFKSKSASADYETDPENTKKLEDLKKYIRRADSPWHWCDKEFSTPKELGEQVKRDFLDMLDRLYPKAQLSRLEENRLLQQQYASFLLENYVADSKTIDDLFEELEKAGKVVVTGDVGIGKSSTLAYFANEYRRRNPDAFVVEHYVGAGGQETSTNIAISILEEIRDRAERRGVKLELPEGDDEIHRSLSDWFRYLKGEDVLLVVDGLDQLPDPKELRFIAYLPRVRVLSSCRDNTEHMKYLLDHDYKKYVLAKLDGPRIREIIVRVLGEEGKELSEGQIERIAGGELAGNPLYLKTLLSQLSRIDRLKEQGESQSAFMDRMIAEYLGCSSLEDLYRKSIADLERIMEKYFSGEKGSKGAWSVAEFLKLVAVSRGGLSENEITGMSGVKPLEVSGGENDRERDIYSGVNPLEVSVISNYLDYHLARKNGLLDFFHKSLRDAVYQKYLSDRGEELEVRRKIAEYFKKQGVDDRQMFELPYQLSKIGDRKELKDYLRNLDVFGKFFEDFPGSRYYEFVEYANFAFERDCGEISGAYDEQINYLEDEEKKAWISNNLGIFLGSYDCFDEALRYYREALDIDKKVYGWKHADVAAVLINIGLLYYRQGNYGEALRYFSEALKINERLYGKKHADVAAVLINIGLLYSSQRKYDEALRYFREALEILERLYGRDHPLVAKDLKNLGLIYQGEGNYDVALRYFGEALEIHERLYGREHPDVADDLKDIGNIYYIRRNYYEALKYFKEALEIHQKFYGRDSPEVADDLKDIGNIYYNEHELVEALKNFEEALEIYERLYARKHPDVATVVGGIGGVYDSRGDYNEVLKNHKEALEVDEMLYGRDSPEVADDLKDIGLVYYRMGKHKEALKYFGEALEIHERLYGTEHTDVATDLKNIGCVYHRMGKYEEAKKYLDAALRIYKETIGENDPMVQSIIIHLKILKILK